MSETDTHEMPVGEFPAYNEHVSAEVVDATVVAAGDTQPRVAVTVTQETTETLPMALHDQAVYLHWQRTRSDNGSDLPAWLSQGLGITVGFGVALGSSWLVLQQLNGALTVNGEPVVFDLASFLPVVVLTVVLAAVVYGIQFLPRPGSGVGR